ncbi:hypothetical protein ACHAWU_004802, partial [Discostella pseudostelligera]
LNESNTPTVVLNSCSSYVIALDGSIIYFVEESISGHRTMTSSNNDFSYSARSIRNGLTSGYAAGITGVVIGHPLDSVKVLLQTNGGGASFSASAHTHRSSPSRVNTPASSHVLTRPLTPNVASIPPGPGSVPVKANVSTVAASEMTLSSGSIIGNRSIRALYAGVTGPLLTIGVLQSVNFAIYDSVRRVLYERQLQSNQQNDIIYNRQPGDYLHYDNLSNVAVASFISGASISVLTSPMMIVKTKQQLMVWGFKQAIRETYRSEVNGKWNVGIGLRNFYTGFGVHFVCESIGRSVYMFAYELFKRQLAHAKAKEQSLASSENLSVPDRMFCAASAGMTSWLFIFPADVIRSKLYARTLTTQSSPTACDGIEMARLMIKEQGIRSLYRGMGITVARAGPVAAAVLPVYDAVLAWLSSS